MKQKKRENYLNWDEYFMGITLLTSKRSKDPSSQVGACIVDSNNRIVSIGYNGAPNGISDEIFPWKKVGNPLETKYLYVCHSEMNAIMNSGGRNLSGTTIYVNLFPCNECAKLIIQAGIKKVIYYADYHADEDIFIASKKLLDMAGIPYEQYKFKNKKIDIDL